MLHRDISIWKNFKAGDLEKSKAAQDAVGDLRKNLYATVFSPAAVKKALTLMGEEVGVSRYPITFTDEHITTIKAIVKQL